MVEKREYSPEYGLLIQRIDCWFQNNQGAIADVLEKQRQYFVRTSNSGFLDLDLRSLSEMPLCTAISDIDATTLPEGFHLIPAGIGYARVNSYFLSPGFDNRTAHGFFFHPEQKTVLCLTFGQFVLPFETMTPGGRIEYLRRRFPHLVTVGMLDIDKGEKSGLAILRGDIEEIRDIGIEYTDLRGGVPNWMPVQRKAPVRGGILNAQTPSGS